MIKKVLLFAFCAILFSGCFVSEDNVKLNKQMKPKENTTLKFVSRENHLNVITPFSAIASGFFKEGSYAKNFFTNMYNDKNGKFSISNYLSIKLGEDLSSKYGMKFDTDLQKTPSSKEFYIEDFIEKVKDSDYIIDNYVTRWTVMYYKLARGYYVVLSTKMRLIDTKSQKVIAEGYCNEETEYNSEDPLTYDKLFDNNSKVLIIQTKKLIEKCLTKYKQLI